MTQKLLLTHTDLDGAGCAVLFSGARPGQGRVELVDNGRIDARVLAALESERAVVVTDHGLSEETANRIDDYIAGGGHFTLLDHHRSSSHLAARRWATIDETRSATGLLFDHLGRPAPFADFARLVEDHDLWRHSDERSARLAGLLGLLGHERFQSRFTADPSVDFREGELLLMEQEDERREKYLAKKVEQAWIVEGGGNRWAVCYAEEYQSDLAERLMTALDAAGTAIVNPAKRTVSLRGRGIDVSAIAERFGGGGHARAAAFSFKGQELEAPLAAFEESLSKLLLA
ncbi:MAG TPA: DHHA1 domain-containing protein [Candidatus Dormibacteraeota bacterium]|nr:DHHA1 domain-containing protein [Candidatus Dormibacteraeota bacterium]